MRKRGFAFFEAVLFLAILGVLIPLIVIGRRSARREAAPQASYLGVLDDDNGERPQ
jgi:hypothetical protein